MTGASVRNTGKLLIYWIEMHIPRASRNAAAEKVFRVSTLFEIPADLCFPLNLSLRPFTSRDHSAVTHLTPCLIIHHHGSYRIIQHVQGRQQVHLWSNSRGEATGVAEEVEAGAEGFGEGDAASELLADELKGGVWGGFWAWMNDTGDVE